MYRESAAIALTSIRASKTKPTPSTEDYAYAETEEGGQGAGRTHSGRHQAGRQTSVHELLSLAGYRRAFVREAVRAERPRLDMHHLVQAGPSCTKVYGHDELAKGGGTSTGAFPNNR